MEYERLKIRVKKTCNEQFWYYQYFGRDFYVRDVPGSDYQLSHWHDDGHRGWLFKSDCKIITDLKPIKNIRRKHKLLKKHYED
jgi:hypothetical protein